MSKMKNNASAVCGESAEGNAWSARFHGGFKRFSSVFQAYSARLSATFLTLAAAWFALGACFPQGSGDILAQSGEPGPRQQAERIVLLAFTSEHCPACRALEPLIAGLEKKNYPIKRISPQSPGDQALYDRYGISTMPSFVILVDGQEAGRFISQGEGMPVVRDRLLEMFQKASATLAVASAQAGATQAAVAGAARSLDKKVGKGLDMAKGLVAANAPVANQGGMPKPAPASGTVPTPMPLETLAESMPTTVRLRVSGNGNETDNGTGTIIHYSDDGGSKEGLVLTCGHLFRDTQGNAPVNVDLFDPKTGKMTTVEGECVFYDDDLDIGFVGIPLPFEVTPSRLAPPGFLPKSGDQVYSVGCTSGGDPTVWQHSVVSTDKKFYQPKNSNSKNQTFYYIEVSNAPRPGRSGGGLFVKTETGENYLIGVCNAGDTKSDEGYFLPASVVYDQLYLNKNLSFVYSDIIKNQGGRQIAGITQGAGAPIGRPSPIRSAVDPEWNVRSAEFLQDNADTANARIRSVGAAGVAGANGAHGMPGETPSGTMEAGLEELRRCHSQGAEIICIINWPKTEDNPKESDVIRIPQAN